MIRQEGRSLRIVPILAPLHVPIRAQLCSTSVFREAYCIVPGPCCKPKNLYCSHCFPNTIWPSQGHRSKVKKLDRCPTTTVRQRWKDAFTVVGSLSLCTTLTLQSDLLLMHSSVLRTLLYAALAVGHLDAFCTVQAAVIAKRRLRHDGEIIAEGARGGLGCSPIASGATALQHINGEPLQYWPIFSSEALGQLPRRAISHCSRCDYSQNPSHLPQALYCSQSSTN